MADLILVNQQTYHDQIAPKIQQLKTQMTLRSDIWNKVSYKKKRLWITSNQDPLMTLAFQMGQYLKNNFPELLEDYNG